MEIKIIFLIWFLIQISDCRVLIGKRTRTLRTEPIARLKRSPSNSSLPTLATNLSYSNHSASLKGLHTANDPNPNDSAVNSPNTPDSLISYLSNLANKSYQNDDKSVHFTTPKISTDKWIPMLGSVTNGSSAFHGSGSGKTDKRKDSEHERIEKRVDDEQASNGLIRIDRMERFDPIATSASDHLLTKNYHGYRREDAAEPAKKEPQVQYDEHEAMLSLNELERRLKEQLELLENHKKSYSQTIGSSTSQKYPIVHYEGSEAGGFRSLFNDTSPTYPPSGRIRLNTDNQLQDVYAKINFSPKIYQSSQANHYANYQTNQLTSTESYFKSLPVIGSPSVDSSGNKQRAAKPAEVFYLDKTETEIPSVLPTLMPPEHQIKLNSSQETSSFLSTYQPPIDALPTFATSQPADEFFGFHTNSISPTPSQFRSFQKNQLQPYLYKPPMNKNSFPTTPLSYSSINPTNSISTLSSIAYSKPTEYPSREQFNRLPVHQAFTPSYYLPPTTTRLSLPSLGVQPSIPPTYFPASQNTTTFRGIMFANPSVPSTSMPMNNKIIESSSHLSQLNMSPQYVQAKDVAFLNHQSAKEYELKTENPNQVQYHLNGDDKSNYVLVSDHQSSPVTYRAQQFSPTISPNLNSINSMNTQTLSSISSISSPGSMSGSPGSIGSLNGNEMSKLTSNQPIHVINVKSSSSTPDYVKVYDEKTNEMYFIKTSDFNQLKVTHPKLDVFDLRRPNKDYYEPEATKELLKAVEAVKSK